MTDLYGALPSLHVPPPREYYSSTHQNVSHPRHQTPSDKRGSALTNPPPFGRPAPVIPDENMPKKSRLKVMKGETPRETPRKTSYDVDLPPGITPEQAGYSREQIHQIRVNERTRNAAKVAAGLPAHVYPPRTENEKALIEANLEARAANALVPWVPAPAAVPAPVIPASLAPHVADNVDRDTLLRYINRPARAPSARNGGSFRSISNSAYVAAATLAGPPR